ncbi:transcriptional regulator [Alsobacter metallidurans]|uniref:Transcriptional regulator n=1 Tax=Alsobacter metallidurans TaxID=340221 RepID=A0A917I6X4_9HYPH|nr:LysR substrate-binding domain-containing protein [Alsobacter metallidurans]GGH20855.1 transcriptional regulator [Alsobacter metallidurans]
MLNPRQIEAFRAVIVMGSVTGAAQALNVTQPAVTRLVHDFQRSLGMPLFVRRGSRLVPTEEALALYREVERQFVGLDGIARAARDIREGRVGTLRIAALPAFNVGFMPRAVGAFMAERPQLDVALYGSISSQVAEWVASGFCEVGFVQAPIESGHLDIEPLISAPAVAVLPAWHRLAARTVLRPEDFAGEQFVSLENSTQLRYRTDAVFAQARVSRHTRAETPLSMIACAMVAAGAGLSIVDPFTAAEYDGRGVAVRAFRPDVHLDISCIWSAQRSRSGIARQFVEFIAGRLAPFRERSGEGDAPA